MSAAGLLSRLSLSRAARSLRVGSSALSYRKGLESVGKSFTTSSSVSVRKSYPTASVSGVERPRRFYSSEGLVKSAGDMKIAIIGQSMFGKEVRYIIGRLLYLLKLHVRIFPHVFLEDFMKCEN